MSRLLAVGRWIWGHRQLVLLAGALIVAVIAIRGCRRVGELEGAASAAAERQQARETGATPVEPVEDVDARVEDLTKRNADLAVLVDRLRRKLGAKPVAVLTAATEPMPVARAIPLGERLRLEVESVELRGKRGSLMVAGTLAARDLSDAVILRGPFSAPVSLAEEESAATPRAPGRLALGPLVGVSSSGGALYGAAGTFRLLEAWGWGIEALGTGAAGPGGVSFQAAVLVRR